MYINGKFHYPENREKIQIINPATEEVIEEVIRGSADDAVSAIEAARRAMTRYIKRGGKTWIRIFPDKAVTKIPAETRMGKGKGSPEYWVSVVKRGKIMFELAGVDRETAQEAMRLAAHKLPVKTKFIVASEEL